MVLSWIYEKVVLPGSNAKGKQAGEYDPRRWERVFRWLLAME